MIPAEQWLTLHRLCFDTVRAAIGGLTAEQLAAGPAFGDDSIGEQLSHMIGVEAYWLREVGIEPAFSRFGRDPWSEARFVEEFAKIEAQYAAVLGERGPAKDVVWGLGRVCQHALYHYVKIAELRRGMQPGWEAPGAYRAGGWERAVDFLSDLLIVGADAKPMDDGD